MPQGIFHAAVRPATTIACASWCPVCTFADWGEVASGYMEMDLVVHCGTRTQGSFPHTLVLTNVASGWTECIVECFRVEALLWCLCF